MAFFLGGSPPELGQNCIQIRPSMSILLGRARSDGRSPHIGGDPEVFRGGAAHLASGFWQARPIAVIGDARSLALAIGCQSLSADQIDSRDHGDRHEGQTDKGFAAAAPETAQERGQVQSIARDPPPYEERRVTGGKDGDARRDLAQTGGGDQGLAASKPKRAGQAVRRNNFKHAKRDAEPAEIVREMPS